MFSSLNKNSYPFRSVCLDRMECSLKRKQTNSAFTNRHSPSPFLLFVLQFQCWWLEHCLSTDHALSNGRSRRFALSVRSQVTIRNCRNGKTCWRRSFKTNIKHLMLMKTIWMRSMELIPIHMTQTCPTATCLNCQHLQFPLLGPRTSS